MTGDERGLSLPELLLALAIISVGLVGLAVVVPVSTHGVQEGSQLSTSAFLAEQRLEQARNLRWTATPAEDCLGVSATTAAAPTIPAGGACTSGARGSGSPTFVDESAVTGFEGYSRTTRITDCGAGVGCAGIVSPSMRMVEVTVSYRPLTAAGVSPTLKTARLEWLVAAR